MKLRNLLPFTILFLLFCPSANAQSDNRIELSCPNSYTPLWPGGQTYNAQTFKFRQWLCVNNNGDITFTGNEIVSGNWLFSGTNTHSGTETFTSGLLSYSPSTPGTKTAVGSTGIAWDLDLTANSQLGANVQLGGLEVVCHAQNTPSYWSGPPSSTALVAIAGTCIRDGTRTEDIWGANFVAAPSNNLGKASALELNLNNSSSSFSQAATSGIGLGIFAGGTQESWAAIDIDHTTSAQWYCGVCVQGPAVAQAGFYVGSGPVFGLDTIPPVRVINASNPQFIADTSSTGQNVSYDFRSAGTTKWQLLKDTTDDWQLIDTANTNFVRFAASAGANGNTIVAAPGTGIVQITSNGHTSQATGFYDMGRVYNAAGTQQTNPHIVKDTCTLGTNCSITLAGAAVFTSNTSYDCWARDATTAANAVTVTRTSGSALAFTGTGTDVINYECVGN